MAHRLFRPRSLLFVAVLVLVLFLARSVWLPAIGYALIHDEGPAKADAAVVLGGDSGDRILKAGELVRTGYVPVVLVSGPRGPYGLHESDFAIPFAVRNGFPADWFVACPNETHSTREEAVAMLQELRKRGVRSFLLVTSEYHSARARRIFLATEKAAGGPSMRVVASPDEFFRADSWWRTRESQKTVFFEWSKSVATVFGL